MKWGNRLKLTVFVLAKYLGLFALSRHLTRRGLRILCYHGIWIGAGHFGNFLFMQPAKFAQRMAFLAKSDFPVLPLAEAVARFRDGTHPDGCTVITIDDGWYGSFKHMVPVLAAEKLPATFYVTTYYAMKQKPVINVALTYFLEAGQGTTLDLADIDQQLSGRFELSDPAARAAAHSRLLDYTTQNLDQTGRDTLCRKLAENLGFLYDEILSQRIFHLMSPPELAAVAEQGLDIQLHTHRHRFRCEDPDDIRQEITVNRDQLEAVAGTDLKHFCYPSGVYDLSHRALLTELGIETATTLDQGINFAGADPLALARLSDGQEVHQLEFEAEISGFGEILRRLRGRQPSPAGALRLGEMLGRAR